MRPISSLLLAFIVPAVLPVFATGPIISPTDVIELAPGPVVTKGMSRDEVVAQMGKPDHVLANDEAWIYYDFHAKYRPPDENLDALVVVFAAGRTSFVRLTSRAWVMAAAEKPRAAHRQGKAEPVAAHPSPPNARTSARNDVAGMPAPKGAAPTLASASAQQVSGLAAIPPRGFLRGDVNDAPSIQPTAAGIR